MCVRQPDVQRDHARLHAKPDEKQRKQQKGMEGSRRARQAAAADAAGAAMGSMGLLVFALLVWRMLPEYSIWLVIPGATLAWAAVAVTVWMIRKRI